MRTCPIGNCRRPLRDHACVCRECWWRLGRTERAKLQAVLREFEAARIDAAELRRRQHEVLRDRGMA